MFLASSPGVVVSGSVRGADTSTLTAGSESTPRVGVPSINTVSWIKMAPRTRTRRRRSKRVERAKYSWTTTDLQNTRLTKQRLKNSLYDHVFGIYVLRMLFAGVPMTKIGIVRSGSLRQRLSNHLSKAHYDKVHGLCVVTLASRNADERYLCDGIVNTTEANIKRALSRAGVLVPRVVPGKGGVCETEVVLRCDETRALALIQHYTTVQATQRIAETHEI